MEAAHRVSRSARAVLAGAVATCVLWAAGVVAACSGPASTPPMDSSPRSDSGSDEDAHRRDGSHLDGADRHDSPPAVPYLTSLGVTSSEAGSAISLVPAFSPDKHDYYVRCAAGTNVVNVTMAASPGAVSMLVAPQPSAALPSQTLTASVLEDQAVVAVASNSRATVEYWVRCLPHDMPPLVWAPNPEAGATPTPGYYLVGDDYPSSGRTGYALILNGDGVPVWYTRAPAGRGAYNVDQVLPGSVTFIPSVRQYMTQNPYHAHQLRPLLEYELTPDGTKPDVHELRLSKGGNTFLVTHYKPVLGYDLTGLSVVLPNGPTNPRGKDMGIHNSGVLEFALDGTIVNNWWMTDHFTPKDVTTLATIDGNIKAPDGGPIIDAFHCNSIDVDPSGNGLLVSSRHTDSIFYVDWPGGTVLWKLGGKPSSKDPQTVFLTADSPFYSQHDARFQPGWSSSTCGGQGQISMFDDETFQTNYARAIVYDVTVGGADGGGCDGGAPGARARWQVPATSTSAEAGSFRIYKDGTRLVDWGYTKQAGLVFSEVSYSGTHLLDFSYGNGDESYRAVKVPLSAFEIDDLRATAGLP